MVRLHVKEDVDDVGAAYDVRFDFAAEGAGFARLDETAGGDEDDQGRRGWTPLPEDTVVALVYAGLLQRVNDALYRGKAGRAVRYGPGEDPEGVLERGRAVCAHRGKRLTTHRDADGPDLFCQTRQRGKTACPDGTIKASILDRVVWARIS